MTGQTQRDSTIDIAKGITIIAIVVGHVLRGLTPSGILDGGSPTFDAADRVLYMVHVPVFAFLAGLFVAKGVDRAGAMVYLQNRLAVFVYLYLLWQILQIAVKIATGVLVNNPPLVSDLWSFWKPEGQLWFLPFLMIVTTLAVLLRPWRSGWLPVCGMLIIAATSVLAWGIDGVLIGTRGTSLFIFFFAGAAIGHQRIRQSFAALTASTLGAATVGTVALFALLMTATVATPPTVDDPIRTLPEVLWGVLASLVGVIGVLGISALLARISSFPWLAFVGQRCLEVFLAHIIAASGTRILLSAAGIDDPVLHVTAGTLAGVALPLILWWTSRRLGFPWLFELPRLQSRTKTATRA